MGTKKDEEYFEVDGIENYKLKKRAWNFTIAVEHENKATDWSDEVIKLA